jgi:hypothetical protein
MEKIVYEVRINGVTLSKFDKRSDAVKYAKNEIKDSEHDGYIDIFQIKESILESIRMK